ADESGICRALCGSRPQADARHPHQVPAQRDRGRGRRAASVMDRTPSALCLACGLCCTGALHAAVDVKPEHVAVVRSLGLQVEHIEGQGPAFRQPCPLHHDDGTCAVYARRPPTCQNYRCALLRNYESGKVELAAALAIVAETKRIVAEGASPP